MGYKLGSVQNGRGTCLGMLSLGKAQIGAIDGLGPPGVGGEESVDGHETGWIIELR